MEKLAFHSLFRWKMIILPNSHYITYTFLFWRVGRMYSKALSVHIISPPLTAASSINHCAILFTGTLHICCQRVKIDWKKWTCTRSSCWLSSQFPSFLDKLCRIHFPNEVRQTDTSIHPFIFFIPSHLKDGSLERCLNVRVLTQEMCLNISCSLTCGL